MTETQPPRLPRSHRVLIAVGLVALVGLIAVGLVLPRSTESSLSGTPIGTPTHAASGIPTAAAPDSAPGSAPASPGPLVPVPTAGVRTSTEVETEPPGEARPPSPPEVASLLPGGVPASKSELGALVAGFPAAVPIVENSTIISSSITSSGTKVQATVAATTPRSAADVLSLYETAFAALGLPSENLQSASGDTTVAFSRAGASVTLSVTSAAKGSSFSLFAVIDAGS